MAKAPIQDLDECIDTVAAQLIGVIPESEEISVAAASGKALGASSMEKRIFGAIARRVAGEYVSLIVK
jgi:septum site-determining protein MinD